jgi:beta-glucosidase
MILETQQNSDITYRVYDYDRTVDGKPRTLHIDKSIDVITVPARNVEESVVKTGSLPDNTANLLCSCQYFKVWKINVSDSAAINQEYPFLIMSVIEGDGTLNGHPVRKGDHFILPAGYGEVRLEGKMELIASTI